jgi:thioredoxin reductase (NADPH)
MFDVIIIGGGICGFSSAMYAGRLGLRTLVLEGKALGGTITTTNIVENWPGIKKISGEDLANRVMEHAKEYKITVKQEWVNEVRVGGENGCFNVRTDEGIYEGKTIIFANGAEHKKHPGKNADTFENKGVHYCALCDGPLYSGKTVAVIGGGDSAAKEALLLSEFARKVHLIIKKDRLRGEPINNERVRNNKKIVVHTLRNVVEFKGDKKLESIVLEKEGGIKKVLKLDGTFVAIGIIPLSNLAITIGVNVNRKKEIVIDRTSSTNIRGIFACGDVTNTRFKQAITGVGEAVTAAYWAYTYVNDSDYVCPHGDEKP